MRSRTRLIPAGTALAVLLAAGPAAAAVLPPNNPPASIPFSATGSPCRQSRTTTPDSSTDCLAADLARIDSARAQEGVGPMVLPATYAQLTGPEQQFVVIDLERVDRGLPPFTALTAPLNALASQGAGHGGDPPLPSGGVAWAGGIWAGGFPSTLEADFAWMYDDGPGSFNLECTATDTTGCWGHRDIILAEPRPGTLVAGAADGLGSWGPEYAMVLSASTSGPGATVYGWQQAVAAGAGRTPAGVVTLPTPSRVAGADRVGTANAVSQATWASRGASGRHAASAVVARDDDFPDALAAVPLADAKNGPLLLSDPSSLDPSTLRELTRILPPGSTVYLAGGTSALAPGIETTLAGAGFLPVRIAGGDRFATATAIAGALGNPSTVLEADGLGFADALSAGPAAAIRHGAVLLTDGSTQAQETGDYLAAHHPTAYAIGGPASAADPTAQAIVGSNRYDTAARVASAFFTKPAEIGFATGTDYPDALAAGAQLAKLGAPLLLVGPGLIPAATANYVASDAPSATVVYGGVSAIPESLAALL